MRRAFGHSLGAELCSGRHWARAHICSSRAGLGISFIHHVLWAGMSSLTRLDLAWGLSGAASRVRVLTRDRDDTTTAQVKPLPLPLGHVPKAWSLPRRGAGETGRLWAYHGLYAMPCANPRQRADQKQYTATARGAINQARVMAETVKDILK